MSPAARRAAAEEIRRWNRLPEDERRRIRQQYQNAAPEVRRQMRRKWQAPSLEPARAK